MNDHIHIKELISAEYDGQASSDDQALINEHLKDCSDCRNYSAELRKLSATLHQWTNENPSPDLESKVQKGFKEAPMQRERQAFHKNPLFRVGIGGGGVIIAVLALIVSLQTYSQRAMQARVRDAGEYLSYNKNIPTGRLKSATDDIGSRFSQKGQGKPSTYKIAGTSRDTFASGVTRSMLTPGEAITGVMDSQVINTEFEFWGGAPSSSPVRGQAVAKTKLAERVRDAGQYLSNQSKTLGSATQYEPYYLETDYKVVRNEAKSQALTIPERERVAGGFQESSYHGFDEEYYLLRQQTGNTEQYDRIYENQFLTVTENPLSTFSIDVDTASYSNMRRFINTSQMPPADSVRIEELINYFSYDYPDPEGQHPFSVTTKAAVCPWNKEHDLVSIGIQGKTLAEEELLPSNLVFLIDVSGSMNQPNKLPLLKNAFKMMVNQLGDNERVAIVVYAGAAGKVLDSTPGSNKQAITSAINNLSAGGSTAGGAGIRLAYEIARNNFIQEGNNRVILATDGDFNVGVSSNAEMVRLIEKEREAGVFLTVLGFGTGNYKDSRMEQIANKGNGNYYYIDTDREAKKVLVSELGSTLFTIAKDVKLQIEFNPSQVKAYRLIGYENRMLAKEDFNDDTKDAGELGAGHTVTALYEIVPRDSEESFRNVDDLTYQKAQVVESGDLMTVKLRYKQPAGHTSQLIKHVISENEIASAPSGDFAFAASVAEFGLLLRRSEFKKDASYNHVLDAARKSKGEDKFGYRAEFITLVEAVLLIDVQTPNDGGIMFKNR